MSMIPPTRGRSCRLAAWMVLALCFSGCATWQTTAEAPGTLLAREEPSTVRLNVRGGAVASVRAPMVRNDSIVSGADPGVGFATRDVESVEVRRFSASRTLGLAAAGLTAAALWTAGVVGSGSKGGDPDPVPKLAPVLLDGVRWLGRLVSGS